MPILSATISAPLAESFMSGKQAVVLLVLITAIALSLISIRRKHRERGPSPRAYAREQMNRLERQKTIESDLNDILMHLQQFSREMNANLDAKLIRIERAFKDADLRIEELERLVRRSKGSPALDVTVGDDHPLEPSPARRKSGPDPEKIHALTDRGLVPKDIAVKLGRSLGEVELIVAMYNAGKARFSATAAV